MRLGLDSYSLRWQGWDAFQFLDYTANLGLDNVQFSSRDNLGSLEEGYLRTLRDYAATRRLTLELGIGSIDLCWPFTPSAVIRWQSRHTSARISARME